MDSEQFDIALYCGLVATWHRAGGYFSFEAIEEGNAQWHWRMFCAEQSTHE